jgi:hypothetical protein
MPHENHRRKEMMVRLKNPLVVEITFLICSFFFVACGESQRNNNFGLPSTPETSTNTISIRATKSPQPNPTERIFLRTNECGHPDDRGHIFFLNPYGATEDSFAYNRNLYVVNGNGCFPRLVMKNVSGSPAWSKDWKQIAIGCEKNTYLCILNVKDTLDSCSTPGPFQEGDCNTIVEQKYALPKEVSGETFLSHISWSSDNSQIIVDGQNSAHILQLDKADWRTLSEKQWPYAMDWSPSKDILVTSGLSLINPTNGDKDNTNMILGIEPQWSPDGMKIAFLKPSEDQSKEPLGIAVIDPSNGDWTWLYEPAIWDNSHWPAQNLSLGDSSGLHRVLSWSPDEHFIAFVSLYKGGPNNNQIFRLDIESREITILTEGLGLVEGGNIAPAWGP